MKSIYFFILMTVTTAFIGCSGGNGGGGGSAPGATNAEDPSPLAKGHVLCESENSTDVLIEKDPNRKYEKGEIVSVVTKYGPAMRKVFVELPGEEEKLKDTDELAYWKTKEDGTIRCQRVHVQDEKTCLRYLCNFTEYQE